MANQIRKYEAILEYVRDRIISGEFAPGDRLPSDSQLVRMFSSSRPTVAKAMLGLEKEGFLERRTGSGSFVRVQAESKPSLIGMLAPEFGKAELFGPVCDEIVSRCRKLNLSLLRTHWPAEEMDDATRERCAIEYCEGFIEKEVAGVFFSPVEFSEHMTNVSRGIATRLSEAGIPIVLLDRDLEQMPDRSPYDLVGVDNFRVGMIQANHFVAQGDQRIAYVARNASAPSVDLRIAGYSHALRKRQLSPMIYIGNMNSPEFINEVVAAQPTAIVCSNDATASMLLDGLLAAGIRVPDDIKLLGVDDVEIAAAAKVPLSTVRQPFREIGAVATRAMVQRIENPKMSPRTISLDVEIVVRESCGVSRLNPPSTSR